MTHARPIPEASQSPYPLQEPPHTATASDTTDTSAPATVSGGLAQASDAITPIADKAKAFAKARPYATAALVGTVALALFNTLRGKRVGR